LTGLGVSTVILVIVLACSAIIMWCRKKKSKKEKDIELQAGKENDQEPQ
jgi:hypothetical protein